MKNSADQGGCYPQRPKAEVDNTLRDLQNSSYPTKAEFNNCFIIHSKYLLVLKVPMTDMFFIFLLDFTLGSDVKSEKIFLVAIFLHPVLAV